MRHGSLFSGIGGFDLAAQWMDWENIFHCEWAEFPRKVLKKNFPKSISYADITKTDFTKHKHEIDIISGGFPCQPFSAAGKRKGTEDDRYLWEEMLRAIREIQPGYIVAENVRGLTNWNRGMVFDKVQADLEAEGFEVLPFLLPACAINAPHRRDRIWFIAHSIGTRGSRSKFNQIDRCDRREEIYREWENRKSYSDWIETSTSLCGINDGIPNRVDRLKGLGNAIVPQMAYEIFRVIELMEVEMLNCQPGDEVQCGVGKNNI